MANITQSSGNVVRDDTATHVANGVKTIEQAVCMQRDQTMPRYVQCASATQSQTNVTSRNTATFRVFKMYSQYKRSSAKLKGENYRGLIASVQKHVRVHDCPQVRKMPWQLICLPVLFIHKAFLQCVNKQ